MKEVIINNTAIEVDDNKTLREVLLELQEAHLPQDHIFTNLFVDEQSVGNDLDNIIDQEVNIFGELKFTHQSKFYLIMNGLNLLGDYITETCDIANKTVNAYQANDTQMANESFVKCIDSLDLFIQTISQIKTLFRDNFNNCQDLIALIDEKEIALLSILKSILSTREKKDNIMLCDLLEYELIDSLKQWKITLIPRLKEKTDT